MGLVKDALLDVILEYHNDMENPILASSRRTNQYHLQQSCIAFTLIELEEAQEARESATATLTSSTG